MFFLFFLIYIYLLLNKSIKIIYLSLLVTTIINLIKITFQYLSYYYNPSSFFSLLSLDISIVYTLTYNYISKT